MHVPFDVEEIDYSGQSFGTLEFWPSTKISIKLKNANSLLNAKDFAVTYSLPAHQLLVKPLLLIGTLLAFAIAGIVLSRTDIKLYDDKIESKKK